MSLLKFLIELIKEILLIVKYDSEVDETSRAKISRLLVIIFQSIFAITFCAVTTKALITAQRFKEYRELHHLTAEQCLEKNHSGSPSDVAEKARSFTGGIRIDDNSIMSLQETPFSYHGPYR